MIKTEKVRYHQARLQVQATLGAVALLVIAGTVIFRFVEKFSWLDSLYFVVVTLTTVGYGDIAPQTAVGKIMAMGFMIVGIAALTSLITGISQIMTHNQLARIEKRLKQDGLVKTEKKLDKEN